MTHTKNNLPLFEEQKQLITEEQKIAQIEKILSQFKQPIPSGFIPIEVEHICSTKPSWEGKPLSERYSFTYEGKWIWIDIPHELMEKLGIEKGEDITQPLYLDPKVLTRKKTYKAITVKENEIFVQQLFTIQNLEKDINKLFKKIEELEEKEKSNQKTITNLKNQLSEKEKTKNDWKNEWLTEWRKKNNLEKEIQLFLQELQGEKQMSQSQKKVYQQKLQHLQTQLNKVKDEKDDYQNKWDNSLENLEQKEEIIGSYLRKIENLENEVEEKNNEINRLRAELKKEQDWWDKWIYDTDIIGWGSSSEETKGKEIKRIFDSFGSEYLKRKDSYINILYQISVTSRDGGAYYFSEGSNQPIVGLGYDYEPRMSIKAIYQYYRDR